MNKKIYQSPDFNLVEVFAKQGDVIMASNTVVDPIVNGGNYNGGQYS